jgi:hypothetical protein
MHRNPINDPIGDEIAHSTSHPTDDLIDNHSIVDSTDIIHPMVEDPTAEASEIQALCENPTDDQSHVPIIGVDTNDDDKQELVDELAQPQTIVETDADEDNRVESDEGSTCSHKI